MAKPKSKPQRSFFDADSFSHLLDPKADGVYLTIKNVIAPLIRDEDYADMYSHLGRRPVSPRTLVLTMLLQFLENLSDRRAAKNVRFRLDWKMVIGLAVNDPGFHFSDLGEFRDRLEKHNKERAAFDVLLKKLKELGLIRKHQKQRLDATHVLGHLRKLSRLECLAESIRLTLKRLADLLEDADFERLAPVDIRKLYTDELTTQNMDQQAVRRSLRSAGGHALTLLERVAGHSKSSELSMLEQVKTLRRVFEQYFEVTPEGAPVVKEKLPKGEGKDRIVTPHEVEARWSEKRGKEWVGYKLQVTETADRPTEGPDGTVQPAVNFITDIAVTNAAEADIQYTQEAIDRQGRRGLVPEEFMVDQAYVSGAHIIEAARKGVLLVGPAAAPNPGGIEMPQELFSIDVSGEEAVCPQGEKSVYWKKDRKGAIQVRFSAKACNECSIKTKCTKNKRGRTLTLAPEYECLQARREWMKTDDFKERMKARNGIEGTISEMCRAHGARYARYRGKKPLGIQEFFSGFSVNAKRLTRAILEGLCPELAFS